MFCERLYIFDKRKNRFNQNRQVFSDNTRYKILHKEIRNLYIVYFNVDCRTCLRNCVCNVCRQGIASLDFLFFTNLDARLSQNVINTFCACFASDFIFLFAVFLLGLTPWGIPVLPFIVFLKGFGTGITAGYLFSVHSLKGIVFYLFVLLPGTFLFCLALILFSSAAFTASGNMFWQIIADKKMGGSSHRYISDFLSRGVSCLILAFLSAVLDAALWGVFAGNFNF